jgi:orotidine-5'-phosphate decarboxylase
VALDVDSLSRARELVWALKEWVGWFKVGKALFVETGPEAVSMVREAGARVFLDLKFHDIPNTVKGAARAASRLGADLFTVHASGGKAMMAAALEGAREGALSSGRDPLVVGVTVLTSIDQEVLKTELGVERPLPDQVLALAIQAREAGLSGVVCSGRELALLRMFFPGGFLMVTPGISLSSASDAPDQKRTVTPKEALKAGSDLLVIGRSLIESPDPAQAVQELMDHILSG